MELLVRNLIASEKFYIEKKSIILNVVKLFFGLLLGVS